MDRIFAQDSGIGRDCDNAVQVFVCNLETRMVRVGEDRERDNVLVGIAHVTSHGRESDVEMGGKGDAFD